MKKYLLDTHVILWYLIEPEKIPEWLVNEFNHPETTFCLSIASIWEVTIKLNRGKLEIPETLKEFVERVLNLGIEIIDIKLDYFPQLQTLELHHRDPFDRIIITTAICEELPLISKDQKFGPYPVEVLW
jgi:PIN domain nuclease of toxin-antitoxin system